MAVSINGMNAGQLLSLREEIDQALAGMAAELEKQLGSKPNKAWSSTSAFGPIPDIGHAEQFVRDGQQRTSAI